MTLMCDTSKQYDWVEAAKRLAPVRDFVFRMPFDWERVSHSKPCSVCGKPDWCTRDKYGRVDCCMRVASDKPTSNGGWLHNGETKTVEATPVYSKRIEPAPLNVRALMKRWQDEPLQRRTCVLAQDLGVTRRSLDLLGCLWASNHAAWAFPMWLGGMAVGIRLRFEDGAKRSVRRSKAGLFLPSNAEWEYSSRPQDPVMIAEGPTDAAALITLGYRDVIGRPSCRGQHGAIKDILRRSGRDTVIVADADGPGYDGAFDLARDIMGCCRSVRLIVPPGTNDVREWVKAGGSKAAFEQVIQTARYMTGARDGG